MVRNRPSAQRILRPRPVRQPNGPVRSVPVQARTLSRRELQVIGRRQPSGAESWAVQAGAVIVECQDDSGPVQVAMSAGAVTGFLSWLESAPPGFAVPGYAAS